MVLAKKNSSNQNNLYGIATESHSGSTTQESQVCEPIYMMQRTMAIYRHQIAATFLQSYRQKYETNQNP